MTFDYFDAVRPLGFILEEVLGFQDKDPETQVPYIVSFMEARTARGYATRSAISDHASHTFLPRPRVYMWGLLPDLGHAEAADWMVARFGEATQHSSLYPPHPVFQAGDCNSDLC